MALAVLMFFSMVVFAQGEIKCYEELGDVGCVSNEGPYGPSPYRLISTFPQSPESINTQFLLFTREETVQYQVISAKTVSSIRQSHFNGSRNSVFIVHGYTEHGYDPWPVEMCQTILTKDDVNCIIVDWSGGSFAIYTQAINNVQVVGAEIAYFIKTIVKEFNSLLSGIHLIGHSLGGQVVGEAGRRLRGIGRITCLDAAWPGFEGLSTEVTIDRTDAIFVVAIHTDIGPFGLGMWTLIGHIDFFPNGGSLMTGCDGSQIFDLEKSKDLTSAARDVALCNHVSSYYMFTYSILYPDGLMGYCAPDYSSFQEEGAGFPCSGDSCSLMGYYTQPRDSYSCPRYYLNTGPRDNYGRYRYNMIVQTGGNAKFLGSFSVTMYNSDDTKDEHKIYSGYISGGTTYSVFFDGLFPPPIARVTFSYPHSLPLLSKPNLWVESATVILGNNGAGYSFCADETTRGNDPQTLTPCP